MGDESPAVLIEEPGRHPFSGTVFFDYDGTLHDSVKLYAPAFRRAYAWLVEKGFADPREFDDAWIGGWLGWTVADMWNAFMPDLPDQVWREASQMIGREMEHLLEAGRGELFPGVPETLDVLVKRGYELAFLSNCGRGYCDLHRRLFGLDRWFSAYYCADDFDTYPKWQMYLAIRDDHSKPQAMVGDRHHDLEVAEKGGIPFIRCAFGYGQPGEFDGETDGIATGEGGAACPVVTVKSFNEIPEALATLFGSR